MFGTTGYLIAKAGMENGLKLYIERLGKIPGIVSISLYKIRGDKNDYVENIRWVDENTHDSIISQPDFPKIYQELLDLLAEEPVWYSGNLVYTNL